MSHYSFYAPSLPAVHYLFTRILGAMPTRHALNRANNEEWMDFILIDAMGKDQISIHLDPVARQRGEPAYSIDEIRDEARGRQALVDMVKAPSSRQAVIGKVKAPMPHWGPVYTDQQFDEIVSRLRAAGIGETLLKAQLHHAGLAAEHKSMFFTLGSMHFEIKGYYNEQAITADIHLSARKAG